MLEDAEFLGMGGQVGNDIGGFTPVIRLNANYELTVGVFHPSKVV